MIKRTDRFRFLWSGYASPAVHFRSNFSIIVFILYKLLAMGNLSIYLSDRQQQKLDFLSKKGIAEDLPNSKSKTSAKRNRSAIIATLVEREYKRLIEAEMVADAIAIDTENLGWSNEEELCQIIDSEQSGR